MSTSHNFEENRNPNATIAFIMWNPFHYWVYKNIAKYLPESEFVVCDTWFSRTEHNVVSEIGADTIRRSTNLLKKRGAFWRVMTSITEQSVPTFFSQYNVIISVHLQPPLDSVFFTDDWLSTKKSVLVNYGVAKDLITFAPWVSRFDVSLAEGPRTKKYQSLLCKSYVVGVPKFDDWFKKTIDTDQISQMKSLMDPRKKTILYLPTHSKISSLYALGDLVDNLAENYNLLIKLHPYNSITEADIVERIKKNRQIHLFGDADDILGLFYLADIVVSDSSSAAFETLLADRPIVIFDTLDDKLMEQHISGKEFNGFWHSGGLTYAGSVDQQIKKAESAIGQVVRSADELINAINNALTLRPRFERNRQQWKKALFARCDGKSGERAARIIKDFMRQEKPEPPPLGMAFRTWLIRSMRDFRLRMKKRMQVIQSLHQEIAVMKEQVGDCHSGPWWKKIAHIVRRHF